MSDECFKHDWKRGWSRMEQECPACLHDEIERLRKQRDTLRRAVQVFRGEISRAARVVEECTLAEIGDNPILYGDRQEWNDFQPDNEAEGDNDS